MVNNDFTSSEQLGYEWSRSNKSNTHHQHINITHRHRRSDSSNRSRSSSVSSSGSDSDSIPREPFNPLNLAYTNTHRSSKYRHRDTNRDKYRDKHRDTKYSHRDNRDNRENSVSSSSSVERWKHDLYESDSERIIHENKYKKYKPNTTNNTTVNNNNSVNSSVNNNNSNNSGNSVKRRGWRSKAGGVYIPPESESEDDLYTDYKPNTYKTYERPDPSYTLD